MGEYTFSPGNSPFWTSKPDFRILREEQTRHRPYWYTESEHHSANVEFEQSVLEALQRMLERLDDLEKGSALRGPEPESPWIVPSLAHSVVEQAPLTQEISGIFIGMDEPDLKREESG